MRKKIKPVLDWCQKRSHVKPWESWVLDKFGACPSFALCEAVLQSKLSEGYEIVAKFENGKRVYFDKKAPHNRPPKE